MKTVVEDTQHCGNCGWGTPTNLGSAGEGVNCASKESAEDLEAYSPESKFLKTFEKIGYISINRGNDLFSCPSKE